MIINPVSPELLKRVARHKGHEAYKDLIALLEFSKMKIHESLSSIRLDEFEKVQGQLEQIDSVISTMRNANEEVKIIAEQLAEALRYSEGDKVIHV